MTESAAADPQLSANREYRLWLVREIAAQVGVSIGAFAFPLLALAVTGSATATGIVGFAEGVGGLLGLLPGGILADRLDRQRLTLASSLLGAGMQGVLLALLTTGHASLVTLAGLAAVDRFRAMLLGQGSEAMLKQIAPARQLARAAAVNEGRDAAIHLGAGPVGGALLALGLVYPPLTQLVGQVSSALLTLLMRGDYRPRPEVEEDVEAARPRGLRSGVGTAFADAREAGVWALRQPARRDLIVVAMLLNLGLNGVLVTVTLSLAVRGVPASRIGILSTCIAGSVLVGALLAGLVVEHVPAGRVLVVVLLWLGIGSCTIPWLTQIWQIGAVYVLMGLGLPVVNAAIQGYFVHITPVEMQGRVSAFMGLVAMGLMPLAPGLAGWGIGRLGARPTMTGFALVSVLGALLVLRSRPPRGIPRAADWEEHALASA